MKKRNLSLLLLASASLLMTSCNKISAELRNPNDAVVTDISGATVQVEGNKLKEIYDAIKNGSNYTSAVNELVKEGLSEAYIGKYYLDQDGEIQIEGVDFSSNDSILEFIKEHKFYWNWVDTGSSVTYEDEPSSSNISDYKARLESYKELVMKEIVSSIYSQAVTATYMKNNRFYEILFAKYIYEQLYPVTDADGNSINAEIFYDTPDYKNESNKDISEDNGFTFGKLVTRDYDPEKDYKAIISGDTQLLHLEHYVEYINEKIVPDIIQTLLTQSYIYEKQYLSIGKTQSRKLNFIALPDNSSKDAEEMLREYVETYLSKETEKNVDYTPVIDAWNGVHGELEEDAKYLADTVFGDEIEKIDSKYSCYIDGKSAADYPYYDGSKYGDLIKDYSKLTNNPETNDVSTYSNYTSIDGITYTPSEGLEKLVENLSVTSYVTNEWGTSSTFSISDSTMTNRLFSYGLATEFETATDPDTSFIVDGYYLKQFQKGGPVFLKKESYSNPIDSIIWSSSDTYYIVEIVDQISPDTFATDSSTTQDQLEEIESYAIELGYDVAKAGSFTSAALIYYLKQSNINYHDQDVYDYFETNYSDLFDD